MAGSLRNRGLWRSPAIAVLIAAGQNVSLHRLHDRSAPWSAAAFRRTLGQDAWTPACSARVPDVGRTNKATRAFSSVRHRGAARMARAGRRRAPAASSPRAQAPPGIPFAFWNGDDSSQDSRDLESMDQNLRYTFPDQRLGIFLEDSVSPAVLRDVHFYSDFVQLRALRAAPRRSCA